MKSVPKNGNRSLLSLLMMIFLLIGGLSLTACSGGDDEDDENGSGEFEDAEGGEEDEDEDGDDEGSRFFDGMTIAEQHDHATIAELKLSYEISVLNLAPKQHWHS
ncbi:MAG: hypothetical protein R3D55_27440 [Chloroflexota bacterium]